MKQKIRNVAAAYRDAMISEYESYKGAGRKKDADHVAEVLRTEYDYEVEPEPEPEKKSSDGDGPEKRPEADLRQTTAEPKPPEAAVEPKPQPAARKTASSRTAAKKTAVKDA